MQKANLSTGLIEELATRFDYTQPKDNRQKVRFSHEGKDYFRYLPEPVLSFFEVEFNEKEMFNWEELLEKSLFNFSVWQGIIAILNTPSFTPTGGGSSYDNDLPKRKDELEEKVKFAVRCA